MKKIKLISDKSITGLLVFAIACSSLLLNSCNKQDDVSAPVISRVRLINPVKKDSAFTEALNGTYIVIEGQNLGQTQQIYFNSKIASLNPTMVTSNNVLVQIPADAPTDVIDSTVSNTIVLVTPGGQVTYSFTLLTPPPTVALVSNENAVAGSVITLFGSNLYGIRKIVFTGGAELTSGIVSNEAGTYVMFTVPGVVTEGPVTLVNKNYSTPTTASLFNYNGSGIYCNFDTKNKYSWGGTPITADAVFPGGTGNYCVFRFTKVAAGNWDIWGGTGRATFLNPGKWIDTTAFADNINNYAMKFEMNVTKPWKYGTFIINPGQAWKYTHRLDSPDSTNGFVTHGWVTQTIPLNQFRTKKGGLDGTGDPGLSFYDVLGKTSLSLSFMFVGSNKEQGEFEAAIDNIRIVKIN